MAEFKGGDVVFVPMPVAPEMVIWAHPGPTGDIPYAEVEALVDAEFGERIDTMTTLESSTVQASEAATTAAGTATTATSQAVTARGEAVAAAGTATTAAGSAVTAAGTATEAAEIAEQYALEFDLDVTSTTGAPGSQASATVTGDGPAYQINLQIPRGDKGPQGEVSQAALDAAVATLVDNAPEALNTLSELATSLGNDPNFATTVSTEIGLRAKTVDVNAALNGKAATSHTHTWTQISDAPAYSKDTTGDSLVQRGSNGHINVPSGAGPLNAPRRAEVDAALAGKSDVGHTHPVTDLTATGTRSASTYLRGDGSWATPTNTTYTVPTQAEAEAGTATTARAFSAQRVRQAANAAITARVQLVSSFPTSPVAGVLYLKAE